ncbi:integrator complex subunit 7-like [Sycon ciliatum]|uniref:integrator complex subunit 7-like n=1 Tax=Sycon ciliatum TaxID=27933 RepID=UPI0031F6F215
MLSNKEVDMRRSSEDFIVELDSKLRCGRLGSQCEAIVGLPAIFDSHPFPTLVNAVFLKMAEFFRTGSNFLRLCMVKVTELCCHHLSKIHSADEVVRRFSATLHSNDPFARALALRELGVLALLTAEQVTVQQSVRQALEAHEKVEVDAAIFAARCLSAYNAEFAGSLVEKLHSSINGISVSPDMQLNLLPTLQYVRTQREAEEAKAMCVQLLTQQSGKAQAIAAVRALSRLACAYIVHISDHVSILLSVLEHDARQQVCLAVFSALDAMACQAAHLWQPVHIKALWEYLSRSSSTCLSGAALIVLNSLAWSVVGDSVLDTETYPICQGLCCSIDCTLASLACGVTTGVALALAKASPGGKASEWVMDAVCAVQTTLTVVSVMQSDDQQQYVRGIQLVLTCSVKLAKSYPSYSGDLLTTLVSCFESLQRDWILLFCRGAQRIVSVSPAKTVQDIIPPVVPLLVELAVGNISCAGGNDIAVAVADLLLCCGNVDNTAMERILSLLESKHLSWPLFCVARCAAQRGAFELASRLFSRLSTVVCDEQHVRWLSGLANLCKAEAGLSSVCKNPNQLLETLSQSNRFLYEAAVHFSIAKGSNGRSGAERIEFVRQYCHLRSEMMMGIQQALTCANSMRMAGSSKDGICGEMERCVASLRMVSSGFSDLYRSAFNADPQSLVCLRAAARLCDFLVDCCSVLYLDTELRRVQSCVMDDRIDDLRSALLQKLSVSPRVLSQEDCFATMRDVLVQLMSASVQLPPFVFNDCQGTRIQVAIWPAPKGQGQAEHIALTARTHLALRVEGALHQEGSSVYRHVDMVHIRVSSLHQSTVESSKSLSQAQPVSTSTAPLVKSLKPQGGAFSSEFVLHLVPDVNAVHDVQIEVSVSDRDGAVWTTGPSKSLRVKIDDLAPAQAIREAQ